MEMGAWVLEALWAEPCPSLGHKLLPEHSCAGQISRPQYILGKCPDPEDSTVILSQYALWRQGRKGG